MEMDTPNYFCEDIEAFKICLHCSSPFTFTSTLTSQEDFQNEKMKIAPPSSSVISAFKTIFKLNYLIPFQDEQEKEAQVDFELCLNCSQVLFNLQQLYDEFILLGQTNSYLNQKIEQLDKIIDSHEQNEINCDLIKSSSKHFQFKQEPDESSSFLSTIKNDDDDDLTCNSENAGKLLQGREPFILLERLPAKYLQKYNSQQDSTCNYNSPSFSPHQDVDDDDDIDFCEPEMDNDFQMDNGSDSNSIETSIARSRGKRKKICKISPMSTTPALSHSINKSKSFKQNQDKKKPATKSAKKKSNKRSNPRTRKYLSKKIKYANPCWFCRKHFSTPAECVTHTETEHVPQMKYASCSLVCQRCAKICSSLGRLNTHTRQCELIPCGQKFPKQVQCQTCSKSFGLQHQLEQHISNVHNPSRPFSCDECPFKAKSQNYLQIHKLRKHTEDFGVVVPKIKCDECDTMVKNEALLKCHKTAMHTIEGHEKYQERLAAARERNKASRVNAPPVVTLCQNCNVDFFSRLSLINHRRITHGDHMGKEHICDQCGRDFTRADSLKTHISRVHSDERPFMCDICGKGFKRPYNLSAHVRQTHTEEGRLKYNQKMRERNQRVKERAVKLASVSSQLQDFQGPPL